MQKLFVKVIEVEQRVVTYRVVAKYLAPLLLVLLIGVGCSGAGETKPQLAYSQVTESNALLLDVRTPAEFLQNRIEGAKNVPITELKQRLPEIETLVGGNKSHPIVVYCERGYRANQAREILLKAGFNQVTNLGGIRDWPGATPSGTIAR